MKKILLSLLTIALVTVLVHADSLIYTHIILKKATSGSTSVLTEKNKPSDYYGPAKAFDGDIGTAWCEGKKDEGKGEFIWVETDPVKTEGVIVLNGFGKSRRLYFQNNRVKDYRLTIYPVKGKEKVITGRLEDDLCGPGKAKFDPADSCYGELGESAGDKKLWDKCIAKEKDLCIMDDYDGGGQSIMLDEEFETPMIIKKVKLEILSVYRGKKYNDTCIAEIRLLKNVYRERDEEEKN
ncbi:MAG TPA: hypothetical protein PK358_11780 [Spirochaetota bacterium]|nr:hypothetical protein [Spirochaetota bacterium]HPJ35510.1 hypothetical protein [Spirochaetota bacterium]